MANVYYDPTTWKPFADQSQYTRTGWQNYQILPTGEQYIPEGGIGYGDPYQDYLKQRFAISPRTQQWLKGIEGMTPEKAEAAIQNYFSQTGNTWNDFRFWGDDAMLEAVGMGMPADVGGGPDGTWKSLWNQGRKLAGQKDIAQDYQANEEAMGSDMGDVMSMLPGILAVIGAGGLAGAFSGAGGGLSGLSGAEAASLADAYGVTGSALGGEAAGLSGLGATDAASLASSYGAEGATGLAADVASAGPSLSSLPTLPDLPVAEGLSAGTSTPAGSNLLSNLTPLNASEFGTPNVVSGPLDTIRNWLTANNITLPPGMSSVLSGGNNSSGGLLGTGIGALLQYINGQSTAGQYEDLMSQLLQSGNPLTQPQRQPFLNAATNNISMPNYLQNYGTPIANFYSERLTPTVARTGDLTNSLAANQNGFAREIMGEYNKTLGTLGSLAGLNQSNNAVESAGRAGASGIAASNAGTAAGFGAIGNAVGGVLNNMFSNSSSNPVSNVNTIWN